MFEFDLVGGAVGVCDGGLNERAGCDLIEAVDADAIFDVGDLVVVVGVGEGEGENALFFEVGFSDTSERTCDSSGDAEETG